MRYILRQGQFSGMLAQSSNVPFKQS
jgi:hypothetical protein